MNRPDGLTDQYDAPATMEVYRPHQRQPLLRIAVEPDAQDGVKILVESDSDLAVSIEQKSSDPQR